MFVPPTKKTGFDFMTIRLTSILTLIGLCLFLSACESIYTHQFQLKNNTADTLWVEYVEKDSEFARTFPDSLRGFQFLPSKVAETRTIYTKTEIGDSPAPDLYTVEISALEELTIAKMRTRIDSNKRRYVEILPAVNKDFTARAFWEYFIDEKQKVGVYLFEIDFLDLVE